MRQIAYSQIDYLSKEFSNPFRAKRLMRDYLKDAIKVTTDTLRKDMMFRFFRSRVGFKEVEQVADQMVKQQKSSKGTRDEKYDIVKDLMKHKKKDSVRCLKISKQTLNESNTKLSKVVRKGTLAREAFMEVVDNELNFEWKNGKLKMKDKVECANDKYKGKHEEIQAIGGVLVADKLLEEFEKENELEKPKASIYCEIQVNKEQEEILLLPPEHQKFPKLNVEEFETDLAKCSIKERWESFRDSKKLEKEREENVYDRETKSMDKKQLI